MSENGPGWQPGHPHKQNCMPHMDAHTDTLDNTLPSKSHWSISSQRKQGPETPGGADHTWSRNIRGFQKEISGSERRNKKEGIKCVDSTGQALWLLPGSQAGVMCWSPW